MFDLFCHDFLFYLHCSIIWAGGGGMRAVGNTILKMLMKPQPTLYTYCTATENTEPIWLLSVSTLQRKPAAQHGGVDANTTEVVYYCTAYPKISFNRSNTTVPKTLPSIS